MKNKKPLVSIITPSYNQGEFIEDNLKSVANQKYDNIEHIVIDGGSTDDTIDVLKKYEDIYNLRWISEPDEGQSDAINKGFKKANGDIIGWINSDDAYFLKNTITKVVDYFTKNNKANFVSGGTVKINGNNEIITLASPFYIDSYKLLKVSNLLSQPSTFFRKKVISEYKLRKNFDYPMDLEYWLRLGKKNNFHFIPDLLGCFRIHEKSKTTQKPKKWDKEVLKIRSEYNIKSNTYRFKCLKILKRKLDFLLDFMTILNNRNLTLKNNLALNLEIPTTTVLISKFIELKLKNLKNLEEINRIVK